MDWIEIVKYLAPILGAIVWIIRLEKKSEKNATSIDFIKSRQDKTDRSVERLADNLFSLTLSSTEKANHPLNKEELTLKNQLLLKLRDRTITYEEGQVLTDFLEREDVVEKQKRKEGADNWKTILGITSAIVLISLIFRDREVNK